MLRGVAGTLDFDRTDAGQPARASQEVDAVVRQPALLAGVGVARDHEVPPRQGGLDIDLGARSGVARALHGLARAQQALGGDARPVGALTADQLSLDDGDAQSAGGQRRGAVLAGGAAAEDDHVVVIGRAHRHLRRLLGQGRAPSDRSRPWTPWSMPWSPGPDQGVHGREREHDGRRCCSQQSTEVNMASTDVSGEPTSGTQSAQGVDMALEVVTLPVSDVDRAKSFYESLGWRLRHRPGRQRRHPHGAVHAAPLAVLDPVRQGRHGG